MRPKIKTTPDLSATSPAHIKALEDGDSHFRLWQRNVIDEFKDLQDEEIRQKLKETASPFAVLFEHWIGDFNMATGIRNANGFNAKQIFYVGDRGRDNRGTVGVLNYSPIKWLATLDELIELQNDYTFVGVDNIPGSIPIEDYEYPENTLLCFGEEGTGLTPTLQRLCKDIVHISMKGSVRSFNCGTASGIAMYDLMNKLG